MKLSEGKCKIAAGLVPLVKWLYDNGVIAVSGGTLDVHLEEKVFRATFEEYEVRDRESEEYPFELSTMFDGVKFFACTKEA